MCNACNAVQRLYIKRCSDCARLRFGKGEKIGVRSGAEVLRPRIRRIINVLERYEAHRGTVVRVREGHRNSEFAGMRGTIQEPWVSAAHGAVDVRLEDGGLRLFWLDDLSVVDEDIAVWSSDLLLKRSRYPSRSARFSRPNDSFV